MPSWLPSLASLFFLALLIRLWLWPDRRGPWIGAALLFLACLYGFHWIFVSLHTYGLMPAPVASIATALLALYVSAYGILAGWVIRSALQARASRVPVWSKVLFMAGVITLLEWVRGWLFSGFPWLGWGYHQVDGWLAGFAPWLGVYGVTFFASLTAALIAIGQPKPLFAALFIPLLGGALGSVQFDEPVGSPLRVALIQGAVPQQMKFDPQFIATTKQRHLEMGSALSTPGVRVDLIVFPETAFIQSWQDDPEAAQGLQRLADRAQAVVMTGMPLRDEAGWHNSLVMVTPQAAAQAGTASGGGYQARYDKHHLVPFGEFVPWGFRWFVGLMQMPLGDFQRGAPVQAALPVKDQRIGVNICFEDLFGEELARSLAPSRPAADRPTVLLNLSNLAWFGDSIALPQHLAVARMRSLELARPSIRATNTGMTVHIDANGQVREQLAPMREGILLAQVQGSQGLTPYAYLGNLGVILLALLCVSSLWWSGRFRMAA
jgi:apolipoprotein N-acyltransferase